MKARLKELLDSQIATLLTRIEEEVPSLHSDEEASRRRVAEANHVTGESP
jgi:hypothetical protein